LIISAKEPSISGRFNVTDNPHVSIIKEGATGRQVCDARCIIPATAFIESLGDKKTYHPAATPAVAEYSSKIHAAAIARR